MKHSGGGSNPKTSAELEVECRDQWFRVGGNQHRRFQMNSRRRRNFRNKIVTRFYITRRCRSQGERLKFLYLQPGRNGSTAMLREAAASKRIGAILSPSPQPSPSGRGLLQKPCSFVGTGSLTAARRGDLEVESLTCTYSPHAWRSRWVTNFCPSGDQPSPIRQALRFYSGP